MTIRQRVHVSIVLSTVFVIVVFYGVHVHMHTKVRTSHQTTPVMQQTNTRLDHIRETCGTATTTLEDACVTDAGRIPKEVGMKATTSLPSPSEAARKTATRLPVVVDARKEYGVWVWDSPLSMNEEKMDTIVRAVDTAGMNVIYLTIDDVLMSDQAAFTQGLATFVQKANAQGIVVDAVAGSKEWAKPAYRHKPYAILAYITAYNQTNPKVRAFQYDVEPYLLPEYEDNKAEVLTDFVDFIDESARKLEGTGMRFSVVIPHFYDSEQAWTPMVTHGNKRDYVYNHLVRILDRNSKSSIIIMAYRNYFEGTGGTREIVTPELEQAGLTKVIVAQETGEVEPGYVTFFGHSKHELIAALTTIRATFEQYDGFGGVAVHYLDSFQKLP